VPYTEIRSGLWQELSVFSSVFSVESSSMGLCFMADAHSPSCCKMSAKGIKALHTVMLSSYLYPS